MLTQIAVRFTGPVVAQLDEWARSRGITRAQAVRELVVAGLRDVPTADAEPITSDELRKVLERRARDGNVPAARSLLPIVAEEERRRVMDALLEAAAE